MARRVLGPMLLLIACCGGCYYRQLLPATTICVHDQQGRPVAGMRGSWSGYASEDEVIDKPFTFDPDGCARIPRYNMWTTALNLVAAVIKGLSPHEPGLRPTTSDVTLTLPDGYEVDEAASGLKRNDLRVSGGGISWEGRDDMDFSLSVREAPFFIRNGKRVPAFPGTPKPPDEFVITLWKPERQPEVRVRLILQPKSATLPTTRPSTPSGAR